MATVSELCVDLGEDGLEDVEGGITVAESNHAGDVRVDAGLNLLLRHVLPHFLHSGKLKSNAKKFIIIMSTVQAYIKFSIPYIHSISDSFPSVQVKIFLILQKLEILG